MRRADPASPSFHHPRCAGPHPDPPAPTLPLRSQQSAESVDSWDTRPYCPQRTGASQEHAVAALPPWSSPTMAPAERVRIFCQENHRDGLPGRMTADDVVMSCGHARSAYGRNWL